MRTTKLLMILRNILNKKPARKLRTVSFDAYGNAIPNVPSIKKKGSNMAATIVETRKVAIKPRKKTKLKNSKSRASAKNKNKTSAKTRASAKTKSKTSTKKSIINHLLPALLRTTKPASKNLPAKLNKSRTKRTLTKAQYIPKQEIQPRAHNISEYIELSFKRLNGEFNRREQQLEQRFLLLEQRHKQTIASKRRWLIPAALVGSIAGGYMLYVLTNMQDSMTLMASNIPAMNQHMGAMANDTQAMSGNMQNMNQSMGALNNNVTYMNQQMGSISQSIEPMGKAAETAQPFMGMMRSFFPF